MAIDLRSLPPLEALTPLEKGHLFEDFVGRRFDENRYAFVDCQPDREVGGRSPESNRDPDLVWRFMSEYRSVLFATECKWRERLYSHPEHGEGIEIGEYPDAKLQHYKKYELRTHTSVFLVIGIGGHPMVPSELFIIPLQVVTSGWVSKLLLAQYRCNASEGSFELNAKAELLRLEFWGGHVPPNVNSISEGNFPKGFAARAGVRFPNVASEMPRFGSNHMASASDTVPPLPATTRVSDQERGSVQFRPPERARSTSRVAVSPATDAGSPRRSKSRWGLVLLGSIGLLVLLGQVSQFVRSPALPPVVTVKSELIPTASTKEKAVVEVPTSQPPTRLSPEPVQPVYPKIKYKSPPAVFQLAIEQTEPATEQKVLQAAETARKALTMFDSAARPAFMAIATSPSVRAPRLTAYLIFDTEAGSFRTQDVILVATHLSSRTVAKVQNSECFFVDPSWVREVPSNPPSAL